MEDRAVRVHTCTHSQNDNRHTSPPFLPCPSYPFIVPLILPMIPELLTETLATLRRFDPNGDWHFPTIPGQEADLLDWSNFYDELAQLTEAARLALDRMREAAKRP